MNDISNEKLILSSLISNQDYVGKVLPFIKDEYFGEVNEKKLLSTIKFLIDKFGRPPNKTEVLVTVKNDETLSENQTDEIVDLVNDISRMKGTSNTDWLIEVTEAFCKDKAIFNAIQTSISVYQGEESTLTTNSIPDILQKAISVNFDSKIGSDYYDDAESRFLNYLNPKTKIPFEHPTLNHITNGGVTTKTLNLILAPTGAGKSLGLVDLASGYMRQGYDVLYITLEMAEDEILRRVDGNMFDVDINSIQEIGKKQFLNNISQFKKRFKSFNEVQGRTYGTIKVKEYAPGAASTHNITHILNELKIKQGFVPKIIMVDYVQIMASSIMKAGSVGSYYYYKSISEELRGLAVREDVSVWTAGQFNRSGMGNTDVDMENIAESVAIAHTADFVLAFIRTDELDADNQLMVKQLKSRYSNKSNLTKFLMNVSLEKQKLTDTFEQGVSNTTMETLKSSSPADRFNNFT